MNLAIPQDMQMPPQMLAQLLYWPTARAVAPLASAYANDHRKRRRRAVTLEACPQIC